MKIHVLDDLHLEFGPMPAEYSPPECDVVVLAGDVDLGTKGVDWAAETFKDRPVVYVAGNHEHYRHAIDTNLDNIRSRAKELGIHFLENDTVVIDDVLFIGATLWTDFSLFGDPERDARVAQYSLNDYAKIRRDGGANRLTPAYVQSMHHTSRQFIIDQLANRGDQKAVVVTHHLPSMMSIPENQRGDLSRAAYATSLEHIMVDHKPALWLHGHQHYNNDYTIMDTRIVSNPRGYVGHHLNPGFKPDLVVEI